MAASDLLAGPVMDKSASLLNDTARTVYTYAAQLPYLQIAMHELQEYFQLHNIPMTEAVSAVINVPAGITEIVYVGGAYPTLPTDMIEPESVYESSEGANSYTLMTKKQFLPVNSTPVTHFGVYTWQGQKIKLLAAAGDIDVKIDYIRELFGTPIVDETSIINVINARTFLEFRTAALCAEFIERNNTSSDALNAYGALGLDRATGISIKGTQNISTRRRPFRSAYKRGGYR